MKKSTFYFIFIFIFSSCINKDSIKIGVLFPLTGDASSYGEKGKKAILMAVDEINNTGGIEGKKIEAIYEDSEADPTTGVNATQKLVSIDKVPAIVGDIVSAVTLPAAAIAEKNKVILIAPTSSAPAITDAGEYIYRIWPSDLEEGKAIGNFAKEKDYKRAVILHLNNDYGNSISSIFTKYFESSFSKVVANEAYLETQTDFKAVLTKIKNLHPDVIYIAGYYNDVAKIAIQIKELKIDGQLLGVTAIEDNRFIQIAGKAADGFIYPLATGFESNSVNPITKKFVDNFKIKYNYEPGWVEAHCYDAFMLVCKALKNSKDKISGTSIKNYFDTMKYYDGVTGKIIFDKNGDVIKPVKFKTIINGKFDDIK